MKYEKEKVLIIEQCGQDYYNETLELLKAQVKRSHELRKTLGLKVSENDARRIITEVFKVVYIKGADTDFQRAIVGNMVEIAAYEYFENLDK